MKSNFLATKLFGFCLFVLISVFCSAQETVFRAGKQILLISTDLQNIYGTYYFAVQNTENEEMPFRSEVIIPKGSLDFQAQDGLTADDMQVTKDGQVYIEKNFQPGLSLLGIGFKLPISHFGADEIELDALYPIEQLSIAVPAKVGLKLKAQGFSRGVPHMLGEGIYDGIMSDKAITKGQKISINLEGVPKTRLFLELMVGFFAAILFLSALFFMLRTIPKPLSINQEDFT